MIIALARTPLSLSIFLSRDKQREKHLDVSKEDLLALAYRFNRDHGVPLSSAERDRIIVKLRVGRTQEEVAKVIGMSQQRISEILTSIGADELNIRTKLDPDEQRGLIKLLLKGQKQEAIATRGLRYPRWRGLSHVRHPLSGETCRLEVPERDLRTDPEMRAAPARPFAEA